MRRVAAIPAFDAAATIAPVVRGLREGFDEVWVVDDGSRDATAQIAEDAGARVVRHARNQGKSAAIRTALQIAADEGVDAIVTLDADGQHPPNEAIRLDREATDRDALVLGVRDLLAAGAPRMNRRGNGISNYWLSLFAKRSFVDTQCGLRRYPVKTTLDLGVKGERFAFEGEVVLRAALRGVAIVEIPVRVEYPETRTTHFHVVKDPARIVVRVVATMIEHALKA